MSTKTIEKNTGMYTASASPMTSPSALMVALPTYRRWSTPSFAVASVTTAAAAGNLNSMNAFEGTAGVAIAVATAATLDHAWYITGDAPTFQANKCIKRPQSWSEPPGS